MVVGQKGNKRKHKLRCGSLEGPSIYVPRATKSRTKRDTANLSDFLLRILRGSATQNRDRFPGGGGGGAST